MGRVFHNHDNGPCITRSGRCFDIRRVELDRIEHADDAHDILQSLIQRQSSIRGRLTLARTSRNRVPDDELVRAETALEWCARRISQVKARQQFLLRDGNQSWSTITLAQHFMESAKDHLGTSTYDMILSDARRKAGQTATSRVIR